MAVFLNTNFYQRMCLIMEKLLPFYQKTWFVVLTLIIFYPIGLILLWLSPEFKRKTKTYITLFFIIILAIGFSINTTSENDTANSPKASAVAQETPKTEITVKELEKVPNRNYFAMSENALKSYYKALAEQAGTGIPNVDARLMTYKDWQSTEGMQISQGTFYLAGNENIEHSYTMTWRQKTGQLIKLIINGKKIFYDEEAAFAAMDDYDSCSKK